MRNHFKSDLLFCGEMVCICFIFTDKTCIRFDGGNYENIDIDGDTNIHKLIHIHTYTYTFVCSHMMWIDLAYYILY